MRTFKVQNPTRRETYWGDRPATEIRAEDRADAAIRAAKKRGWGLWFVNVQDPERLDECHHASIQVKVS